MCSVVRTYLYYLSITSVLTVDQDSPKTLEFKISIFDKNIRAVCLGPSPLLQPPHYVLSIKKLVMSPSGETKASWRERTSPPT